MKSVRQIISKDSGKAEYNIQNVAIPEPSSGQVLVQVKACALSVVETKVLLEVSRKQQTSNFPVGQDISGVVVKTGENVTHVRVGDHVVGILPLDSEYSGCGEYCLFSEYDLVKKPRMLTHNEAAAGIGDCIKAYTALHYQARVCGGDTILVIDGASSFGAAAVQLGRLWGVKVIATVVSHGEKQYLESLQTPVGQVIELSERSNILVSSVMEETGGLGVDVVIDNGVKMYTNEEDCRLPSERRRFPTPHKQEVISCLGIGGKWVTSQSDLQIDPPDSQLLYMRGASINYLFPQAWILSYAQQGRYQHILHDAVDKLDRGLVKCKVTKTVSLEEVASEMTKLEEARIGKVVMSF